MRRFNPREKWTARKAVFGCLFAVVLLSVTVVVNVLEWVRGRGRGEAVAQFAQSHGMTFFPELATPVSAAGAEFFWLQEYPSVMVSNLMDGFVGGVAVRVFDYQGSREQLRSMTPEGRANQGGRRILPRRSTFRITHDYQVVVFPEGGRGLPFFRLQSADPPPKPSTGSAGFDAAYSFTNTWPDDSAKVFTPPVIEFFAAHPGWNAEVRDTALLLARRRRCDVEEMQRCLDEAVAIRRILRHE